MLENRVLSWDDEIVDLEDEYKLLPEGEYFFKVINFERAMYQGGAKVPACPKAIVTIAIYDGLKIATRVRQDFLLCENVAWKISQFFRSIEEKKSGEKVQMKWNIVNGSFGKCRLTTKSYVNKFGENKTINSIDKFLPYEAEVINKFKGDLNEKEAEDILLDDSQLPF